MTARALLDAAPEVACRPWPRRLLTAPMWRDMAAALPATPALALLGLWADTAHAHALLFDRDAEAPLLASVPVEDGAYPALSPARPGAAWFERMVRDLWGHHAEGGTDARPWLDHGQWPSAVPMAARATPGDGAAEPPEFLPVAAPGLHLVPLGPIRGGITPAAHLRLACQGERVLRAEARLGYTHKGVPALMRGKPPRAAARFAARLAGEATVAHAAAFARAAEAALETPAPPRAAALRDGMQALERAANHLAALGAVAEAAGAAALAGRCGRERELLLRAAASAFGHRLMMDLVVPGGVSADLAPDGAAAIAEACAALRQGVPQLTRRFEAADLADRMAGTGAVGPEVVSRFAASPALGGDVAARVRSRLRALDDSARRSGETLAMLPDGPLSAPLPVGSGEGLGTAEGVDGTVWHWLRLDGGLIAACFPLDPGWRAWPVLAAALAGADLADVELIVRSIGTSVSGVDL